MKHVDEGSAERKRKCLRLEKTFSLTFSSKRDAKITVDDNPYLKKNSCITLRVDANLLETRRLTL